MSTLLLDGDGLRYIIGFACEDYVVREVQTGKQLFKNGKISETKKWLGAMKAKKFEDPRVVEAIEAKYGYEASSYYQLPDKSGIYLKKEPDNLVHCLHSVKHRIEKVMEAAKCDRVVTYISGNTNFRDGIAFSKKYKGNRDNSIKPLLYDEITKYLVNVWKAKTVEGYEADDALAIVATRYIAKGQRVVIGTGDKDLKQVPCEIIDIKECDIVDVSKDPWGKLFLVDANEGKKNDDDEPLRPKWECKGYGMLFFYAQMIMGDKVDNIGGVPKGGHKKAYDLLRDAKSDAEAQQIVLDLYIDKYGAHEFDLECWDGTSRKVTARDMFIESGQLLYMMREAPNEDLTNLWKPIV